MSVFLAALVAVVALSLLAAINRALRRGALLAVICAAGAALIGTQIQRAATEPGDRTQAAAALPSVAGADRDEASSCRAEAQRIASAIDAKAGRQTSRVVFLEGTMAHEMSYGCPTYGRADVFVGWAGSAKPKTELRRLIASAGAALTGEAAAVIAASLTACLASALKPESGDQGAHASGKAEIACQAFTRDGGGGSVTITKPSETP